MSQPPTNLKQSSPPKVSVCCAWYNRSDFLRVTIDSLLAQDFESFEVVVVNDGSSDPRVKQILDSYDDARLRVIHQPNMGFVSSIRRAIDATTGEYIAIQGAGDISHPDRLRTQWRYMSHHPAIVAIGCLHRHISARNKRDIGYDTGIKVATAHSLRHSVPFTQGTLFMRREIYNKAGGYDPLFTYAQDWELYKRLVLHGEIVRLDQCLYTKLLFDDGASSNPRKSLNQAKYRHLLRVRDTDQKRYDAIVGMISRSGIDVAISDREILPDCRRRQLALVLKGELRMAAEWSDILAGIEGRRALHRLIKAGLLSAARVSTIEYLITCLYRLAISIRGTPRRSRS